MAGTVLANVMVAGLDPRELRSGNLGVEDGRIAWIDEAIPPDSVDVVDCRGGLVLPGNVCGHTHLYSALARGMPGPPAQPQNFLEILEYVWWRLDRALDPDAVRYSGLVGALDAVHAGTTTLVDHHASPNCIRGSLDVMADAVGEVGVRSVLCYEVTDRGGARRRDEGLRENERFLRENQRPLARGMVGAHASFTLGDDSLAALADLAAEFDAGIHIHVAEDAADEVDSLERCGKRVGQRLLDAGILKRNSIAAHNVHLDPDELRIMRQAGPWLVHNCRSNMNNSVGRAPVLDFGDRSALGTDGIDGDMFAESRTAYFRAREAGLDTFAEQFTDMLARGGHLASEHFGMLVGTLVPGAAADLVVFDYDPPTPLTADNLAWHWMFALTPGNVRDVMVDGRWVIRDRECCTVDEEKIRAEARQEALRLWRRMEDL